MIHRKGITRKKNEITLVETTRKERKMWMSRIINGIERGETNWKVLIMQTIYE